MGTACRRIIASDSSRARHSAWRGGCDETTSRPQHRFVKLPALSPCHGSYREPVVNGFVFQVLVVQLLHEAVMEAMELLPPLGEEQSEASGQ